MDKNFLLETGTARRLYHGWAAGQPIYDYHCHLPPAEIAQNKQFSNLSEIWLAGDHYKWRQMRTFGIDERYITGNADPYDKFLAWAKTIECLPGNPLYHWTHLELQRYFGIHERLTTRTARAIWDKANALLQTEALSVRGIFKKMNVYAVGTTDDPIDTLEHHEAIACGTAPIGSIETRVLPSFRPDRALNITAVGFTSYIESLSAASGMAINSVDDVITALIRRLDFFVSRGCRASDHALEYPPFIHAHTENPEIAFSKAMKGQSLTTTEADAYKTRILIALATAYAERDIVMQLHLAAIRNNNARSFRDIGPDTGFDASHDHPVSHNLAALLSAMQDAGNLPKTVLYSLNPKDYYPLGTLMGCFQGGGIRGKIQLGSAWWFLDHKDGMEEQLRILAALGMLPSFIGMLTDSRSFLSYPRHEYFRRILCNLIGTWVENGEFPADRKTLSRFITDISFGNAKGYLN